MRAVIQRVRRASITVGEEVVGRIERGLLVYVGVAKGDDEHDLDYLANKVRFMRIFRDEQGKLNRDVVQAEGAVLVVSNFTLLGDLRKGRRPAFTASADPETASGLYEELCGRLRSLGLEVQTGRFREMMEVEATNDGPINVLIDSKRLF